ncbi:MAG TPA: PIN domain-containing protein [Candidatus Saccharimonadales bacterium]|nr:PIN domain-containing protein [Candidatus Saccharimonadales bacterium]
MPHPPLIFFDTNILIYAHDRRDPRKRQRAQRLIREVVATGQGAISTQVVREFCNVALKPAVSLVSRELQMVLQGELQPLLRHRPDVDFYQRTVGLWERESIGFYDALIVQAALDLGCKTLYSEDLQDGREYGGLTVKNPFLS